MTIKKGFENSLFVLVLAMWNMSAWAGVYNYYAHVDGMVCAFCTYTVAKKVRTLAGVDADSVDVDLGGKYVAFKSNKRIPEKKLAALFATDGFKISNLTVTKTAKYKIYSVDDMSLELNVDVFKADQYNSVYQMIGNIAARMPSRLIIRAPPSLEETLLKPLLMGHREMITTRFIATEDDRIQLQLFEISED
ncbi:hypothetical protein MNBD_BACTEROID07-1027 [hydrothermal vent metagenome]|uniref:Uncharacterized protein n=1 Tax=hydrothermal vent metagenome TaxID=652676 RepID=A0A3B0UI46_9ZZZZ